MCSYCGCEAQPHLVELISEHAEIFSIARDLLSVLDDPIPSSIAGKTNLLIDTFGQHAKKEEAGLFRELSLEGSDNGEVSQLTIEHRDILETLGHQVSMTDPDTLRSVIKQLQNHAELEETDLFPFAWQILPPESWSRIEQAYPHQNS